MYMKPKWTFLTVCLLLAAEAYLFAQETVSGRVLSAADRQPLAGVSVKVQGTTISTATDDDGRFKVEIPDRNEVVLEVSYLGYHTREVRVAAGGTVDVLLEATASALDEVVVVGYGTVRRRDLTGAVSSVKAEEIAFAPVANPIEAIQGRVAGLDIARESGRATSGSSILLRGNRSLTAGSTPLYIIDGIPGNITNLNPNDIESIDVLKDASSTAIYGSAGANGVIIITTKQAKEGQVNIDFDAYLGVNSNGRYPSALRGDAWLTYLQESFRSTNGRTPENRDELLTAWSLNPEQINQYIDNGQWIDWVDETLHTGVQQNYMLSVRGGTEKTKGFFSLGYNSTQGIYQNDLAKLYTMRGGVENKINHWISGTINTGLTWRDNETRPSRVNRTFSTIPVGEVYDPQGNINVYPIAGLTAPSLIADDIPNTLRNNSKNLVLTVNPQIDLNIMEGLTFRSILGTTLTSSRTGIFNSDRTYMMLAGSAPQVRNATYQTALGYSYIWENIANYQTTLGEDHNLDATLVSSWAHNQSESSSAYNEAFLYDEFIFYSLQAGTNPYASSGYTMTKRMSFVGRLNYGYKGKYLLSLTNRTDGVSQLARRWDSFLAGAAAWRISDEAFMDGARHVVSNMKLRTSYGVSGNSNIDAYSTLTEVTSTGLDAINLGGGLLPTSVLTQAVGNPALTWEKSYNLNIGLDLGLFDDRLEAVVEWYDTETRGVLFARNLPFSSGGFTPKIPYQMTANLARMHNRGVEVTLMASPVRNSNFRWNSTLTFAHNKEQVKSIDLGSGTTVDDLISLGLFMGHPSNTVFGYKKLGIWQQGEEADAAVFGLSPGDVKVQSNLTKVRDGVWVDHTAETPVEYTADNPYTISPADRVIIGQGSPKWTAGWQNSWYWKGFDLNIFAIARWGHYLNSALLGHFAYGRVNLPSNYSYWTPENPTNDYPRPYLNRAANHSNPVLGLNEVDGSFIKIKNITLGYALPDGLGRRLGLSRCRVYATMHNPLIYTRSHLLKGMDPETGADDEFPLYRQMVFGINLSF
ncbi:SusC/RagA family TonB-linked outer membrane protein [Parapedobacter composti]|nr:TonB-dependent receptor [Parapedobacter composti]